MQKQITIRALSTWKGREGKVERGDILDVPEARARELVTAGRAVLLKIEKPAEKKADDKPIRKRSTKRKTTTQKADHDAAGKDE